MSHLSRIVLALCVAAGCSKPVEDAQPEPPPPPPISTAELSQARDACVAYAEKICKCAETVETAKEPCGLSKALPEAIDVSKRLATNPKATREDAVQAAGSIRKTLKQCVEQTAKLPALGCPP